MKIFPLLVLVLLTSCSTSKISPSRTPAGWTPNDPPLRGTNITIDLEDKDLEFFAHEWRGKIVRVLHGSPLLDKPPYSPKPEVVQGIFSRVDKAIQLNLTVVIGLAVSVEDQDGFFNNPQYRDAFANLWRTIARRYAKNSANVIYDLMNEPHDSVAKKEWPKYARELTAAIREIDPKHTLMVEPFEWGWPGGFTDFEPTGDSNTVYSFHFYGPMYLTSQNGFDEGGKFIGFAKSTEKQWAERVYPGFIQGEMWNRSTIEKKLEPAFKFRDQYHVPVWCGEFGIIRWSKGAKEWFRDMIEVLEENRMGWAYYAYREKGWHVMDIEMDPAIKYRNQATTRSDTPFVELLKKYYR